jgi:hypothetical protein
MSDGPKTLQDAYSELEAKASELERLEKISELFVAVRDHHKKQGEQVQAHQAQLEIETFSFYPQAGSLKPQWSQTNPTTGQSRTFPDLERYTESDVAHFKSRLEQSANPILRARYAHLLWESKARNSDYAKAAIEAYREAIKEFCSNALNNPESAQAIRASEAALSVFHLSRKIKFQEPAAIELVLELIRNFPPTQTCHVLRRNLLSLVIEEPKSFDREIIADLPELCFDLAVESVNPHQSIAYLKQGEALDSRLGNKNSKWQREIGKRWETLLEPAEQASDLSAPDFCLSAIESYRGAGEQDKVRELQARYSKLKDTIKLQSFGQEIDRDAYKKHIENCRQQAEDIVKHPPEEIFKYLATTSRLIPNVSKLRESAKEQDQTFVFQSLVPKVVLDERGHPTKHFVDDEERAHYSLLFQYKFDIRFDKIIQVSEIIYIGVREGKITTGHLVEYLREHSWLGKNLSTQVAKETIEYTWLDHVIPAIDNYLKELELSFRFPGYQPQTLVAADSLCLKFEGIFRDLYAMSGGITFKPKKDPKNRKIIREKDIAALLSDPKLAELFDENDLQFFKFVLTEASGWNLRGRIAHCLMYPQEYLYEHMNLMILAILRLSKFKLESKPPETPTGPEKKPPAGNKRKKRSS